MVPPDNLLYEYAVVRYVPRVDREEFVNIGLLMLCKRQRWLCGRIELNEERLRAFDPRVNIGQLILHASMFENMSLPDAHLPVEERFRWLAAVKNAMLQVSATHPGFLAVSDKEQDSSDATELLEREFGRLFADIVAV